MRINAQIEVHCDCPCHPDGRVMLVSLEPNEEFQHYDLVTSIYDRGWTTVAFGGGQKKIYDLCTDCGMHGPKKIKKSEEEDET